MRTLRTNLEIKLQFNQIEQLKLLTEKLESIGLKSYPYGGSVRDLLIGETISGDIDIMTVYENIQNSDIINLFKSNIFDLCNKINAKYKDYPKKNILIYGIPNIPIFDIKYPISSIENRLSRADISINGIAFDIKSGSLIDPFLGKPDLEVKQLRIHSPEYIVTYPPNFPRIFRIACKQNLTLNRETKDFFKFYAHCISMGDKSSKQTTLIEFLRFLSTLQIKSYLHEFAQLGFIDYLFPELTPTKQLLDSKRTRFDLNITLATSVDDLNDPPTARTKLDEDIGLRITLRGLVRFALLFLKVGEAYLKLSNKSPYQTHGAGVKNESEFRQKIQQSISMYTIHRHDCPKEIYQLITNSIHIIDAIESNLARENVVLRANKLRNSQLYISLYDILKNIIK